MASQVYGLMAQFSDPETLMDAVKKARTAGYTQMDAYTPFAVEELADTLGNRDDRIPWVVFICGVLGALGGLSLQYYINVIDWPMNVGGRPDFSWPSFIPVTFECGVLGAAIGGVVGMIILNGLPRPYHPVFNVPGFDAATRDKFFLCIESGDPKFDPEKTAEFLKETGAERVEEVEP